MEEDFNNVIPIPIIKNTFIRFNINNDFRDFESIVRKAQPQQPLEPIIINCVNDIIYDNPELVNKLINKKAQPQQPLEEIINYAQPQDKPLDNTIFYKKD